MPLAANVETVEYRVIVMQSGSTSVLATRKVDGYCLPRVEISTSARPAKEIRTMMRAVWDAEVLILDLFVSGNRSSRFATAELLTPTLSTAFDWVAMHQVRPVDLSEEERVVVNGSLSSATGSPFTRTGWLVEAVQWLEDVTQKKLSTDCETEQYNAGGAFSLLRFRMEDGNLYWLKATGVPNAHEPSVTFLLSKLCPSCLPEMLASRPEWNAWIMSGDGIGVTEVQSDAFAFSHFLEQATESMATLQMSTMGSEEDFLQSGAFDQRLDVLQTKGEELFDCLSEAMGCQTSTRVPRVEAHRFFEIREIFNKACGGMDDLNIPNTILHGDLNLGNIVQGRNGCQFIDWAEARVGNPLITLEHLLLLNQAPNPEVKVSSERQLKSKYRTFMQEVCDPATIEMGFVFAPLIAAASAAYGRGDWLSTSMRHDPNRQMHGRMLTRYMDRVARNPRLLAAVGN